MRALRWWRVVLVCAWLGLVGWLVRYEAFPEWFSQAFSGYRGMMTEGPVVQDAWMKILFRGSHVGYTHTRIDTVEGEGPDRYKVVNQTRLALTVLGRSEVVRVTATARLNEVYDLQTFRFQLAGLTYRTQIEGHREEGNRFRVEVGTPPGQSVVTVTIPDDAVLYSPMLNMRLSKLSPGQSLRFRFFEPMTLNIQDVQVRATRYEPIETGGTTQRAVVVETDFQGMALTSWISRDGEVLRQETPLGWTLEVAEPQDAMSYQREGAPSEDLVRALAVPVRGRIHDPRSVRRLRVRIEGGSGDLPMLEGPRQRILERGGAGLVVEALHMEDADPPAASMLSEAEAAAALAATPTVQSDAPAIRSMAREITDGLSDPAAKVEAINRWVYEEIRKRPAVSIPSALDVLEHRSGDCNEHTTLFVALARAAGIPARIRVGLLYQDGAFYYHAWPAVFLDGWRELDPTLGQGAVDAAHLAMLQGDLAEQTGLLRVIGRVHVTILEQAYDSLATPRAQGDAHAADD